MKEDSVPAAPATRVLIVEDHVESATGLCRLLTLFGYDVIMATNGHDAVREAIGFAPQVALIDLTLPVLDGFNVARQLRALRATKDCRLIAMTGWASDEYADRARAAGFDAHLLKPISVDTLMRTLASQTAACLAPS